MSNNFAVASYYLSTHKSNINTGIVALALSWWSPAFSGPTAAPIPSYSGDPAFISTSPLDFAASKASWETLEYGNFTGHNPATPGTAINIPWQLTAVNASTAYALGYFGQGVTLGMMDSGYRATHAGFQTDIIQSVTATGIYGTSGYGYRGTEIPGNEFIAGSEFSVAGNQPRPSDWSHGTGMLGVTSGIRDGRDQHGIAFGSMMYVAKTGGSDTQSHGSFHDYDYWYTANKALVDAGAQVINSSWGSYVQTLNRTRYNGLGQDLGVNGNLANAYEVSGRDGANPIALASVLPNETLKDLEYQYFFSKKTYSEGGIQYNPAHPGRSFMDAIWDAIKVSGTVNVRSAGNNDWGNPFYRPAYPIFNPWAENQWVAVSGVKPPTAENNYEYSKQDVYNEAGLAKWWTVSTPSNSVWTTNSGSDTGYSGSNGTSPATPVATAAMGVLLSRYPNMNAMQVRELMFSTANNKMSDGVRFLGTGQVSASGASTAWTAAEGLPDERWGWGIPDLNKGMYGPGQFLSPMKYNMTKTALDVWSNNISQVAIKQREKDDRQWLANYKSQGIAYAGNYSPNVLNPDGSLNDQAFMTQGILNDKYIIEMTNGHPEMYDKIAYADAMKWRKEWMDETAAYIEHKISNDLYKASLNKQGPGMLVMTGDNTYQGGTNIEAGTLYGFTESFGSTAVNVNGGYFGVLSTYNDLFTMKGMLTSTNNRLANINVNDGGTYVIMTGNDVNVGTLTFNKGSKLTIAASDTNILRDVFYNHRLIGTGTVTATTLVGSEYMVVDPDYAFFNVGMRTTATIGGGATITGTLSWNDASLASYATNNNGRAVANVISSRAPNALMDQLLWSTKDQVHGTLDSLGNDIYLNANNSSIVTSTSLSRTIRDQSMGFGTTNSAKLSDTARMWISGTGNWSNVDYGHSDMDVDSYNSLLGAEVNLTENSKLGVVLGAGTSKFKGGRNGQIDSNDIHIGIYGAYLFSDTATINYGVMHSRQDRDSYRTLVMADQSSRNSVSTDADITQIFAEAAYTALNTDNYSAEPYAGLNSIHIKSGNFSETVNAMTFTTNSNQQTLTATTLGVRGKIPFTIGRTTMALRADASGTHFFGNKTPTAYMQINGLGEAKLEGGKLGSLFNLGLGIEAAISKTAKISAWYTGSYNGNIKSNSLRANFQLAF